ncbi:uncharacterized protein [Temnothorax nylanderi]|uniref:uncharacterized protein n=1 Tax=Temnothorax nylanderi TaxID=102681 RepID=UPI003A8788B2
MSLDAVGALRSAYEFHGRIAHSVENLKKSGEAKITSGSLETRIKLLVAYWTKYAQEITFSCQSEDASAARVHEGEGTPRKSLPRIQLPIFTGRYDEWSAFKDLFASIIDKDTGLSRVEKFHYLKSCVKGEAEQLLKNLPTTADNYQRAVTLLTERYDNKRLLVRACFSTLTALPKLKDESVPTYTSIINITNIANITTIITHIYV